MQQALVLRYKTTTWERAYQTPDEVDDDEKDGE